MQPYFAPYPGYFRLFAAADIFVVYDCVQFPRRGWVHRNQLRGVDGILRWFTLPLRTGPRDVMIRDLTFAEDAASRMAEESRRFPALGVIQRDEPAVYRELLSFDRPVVDYLVALLRLMTELVKLPFEIVTSSSLSVDPNVRGEARIIEIANRLGARHYVNSPGGRQLYDHRCFADAGLTLSFLSPYKGPGGSILDRIAIEGVDAVAKDIRAQTELCPV
jgi:hypothetical protein